MVNNRNIDNIYSVQDNYNKEESEAKLIKYEDNKKRKGAKAESFAETSNKMQSFICEVNSIKRRKGWCVKSWADAEALSDAISDYLEVIFRIGLFPTKTGLALFLGTNTGTLNCIINSADERSLCLKDFEDFMLEFSVQQGLKTEGNPAFNIFDSKARLGMSENSNININVSSSNYSKYIPQEEIGDIIDMIPNK